MYKRQKEKEQAVSEWLLSGTSHKYRLSPKLLTKLVKLFPNYSQIGSYLRNNVHRFRLRYPDKNTTEIMELPDMQNVSLGNYMTQTVEKVNQKGSTIADGKYYDDETWNRVNARNLVTKAKIIEDKKETPSKETTSKETTSETVKSTSATTPVEPKEENLFDINKKKEEAAFQKGKEDKSFWRPTQKAINLAKALKQVESGGDPNAVSADGGKGRGLYQYSKGTWKAFSREYNKEFNGIDKPLENTPENQELVSLWKIDKALETHTPEDVAAWWNSGHFDKKEWITHVNKQEVHKNSKGVTIYPYDTPHHVYKTMKVFSKLEGNTNENTETSEESTKVDLEAASEIERAKNIEDAKYEKVFGKKKESSSPVEPFYSANRDITMPLNSADTKSVNSSKDLTVNQMEAISRVTGKSMADSLNLADTKTNKIQSLQPEKEEIKETSAPMQAATNISNIYNTINNISNNVDPNGKL